MLFYNALKKDKKILTGMKPELNQCLNLSISIQFERLLGELGSFSKISSVPRDKSLDLCNLSSGTRNWTHGPTASVALSTWHAGRQFGRHVSLCETRVSPRSVNTAESLAYKHSYVFIITPSQKISATLQRDLPNIWTSEF